MKNWLTGRLIAGLAAGAVSCALAGCSLDDQSAPALTGPSEFSLAVTATATPDRLPRDGSSQSVVTLTALDSSGRAIAGQRFAVSSSPASATLSTTQVTTDSNGHAVFSVTAPPAATTSNLITISAAPIGTGGNGTARTVVVSLTGPSNRTAPTGSFTVTPTSPEAGVTARFDATATTDEGNPCLDNCSYNWSFGDGSTGSGRQVSHIFTASGSYTTILTVTDSAGSSSSASTNVLVRAIAPPTVALNISPSAPLTDQLTTFTATATPANGHSITRYVWSFGDGTSVTTTSPSITKTYTNNGTFVTTVTVTDDTGQSASASVSFSVTSSVTAVFTSSPTDPQPGQAVFFNASQSTGSAGATITSYSWDFGDGSAGTDVTTSHAYTAEGTYVVHLVVTDSNGKTGRVVQNVIVKVPK